MLKTKSNLSREGYRHSSAGAADKCVGYVLSSNRVGAVMWMEIDVCRKYKICDRDSS